VLGAVGVGGVSSSTSYVVAKPWVNRDVDLVLGGGVLRGFLCRSPSRDILEPLLGSTCPLGAAFSGSEGELDMERTSTRVLLQCGSLIRRCWPQLEVLGRGLGI
jgi:hypothetical protein